MDIYVPNADGAFVSETQRRVAEIIKDYDPYLELAYIPPESRGLDDYGKEFAVIHRPPGREPYYVFFAGKDEIDERLIARLFMNDQTRGNVMNMLEAHENARQVLDMKRKMEEAEERKEFIIDVLKSPKDTYMHNGVNMKNGRRHK
jgi:hypothetical protein